MRLINAQVKKLHLFTQAIDENYAVNGGFVNQGGYSVKFELLEYLRRTAGGSLACRAAGPD